MDDTKQNGKDETLPESGGPDVPIETLPKTVTATVVDGLDFRESAPIPTVESAPVAAPKEKRKGRRGKQSDAATDEESPPNAAIEKRGSGGRASAVKGSNFERQVGRSLSLWLTNGERNNLFSRNVLSGGQFTQAVGRGKTGKELNLPGDLAAAHPQAFEFLTHFTVEVKHNQNLVLSAYLLEPDTSFIGRAVAKVVRQATEAKLNWMFIGKQDRRSTFVLVSKEVGENMVLVAPDLISHQLFCYGALKGIVCMVRFADMVVEVDANKFLAKFVKPKPAVVRRAVHPALVRRVVVNTLYPLPRRPLTTR